ncbi:hypothetical protein AMJ49_00790 [Parcubacteria bacterium DG_74_2]|nr:MAG: hypothetical protein AMJ49_00790 [Parcubacteria bacterium DG_74_2]
MKKIVCLGGGNAMPKTVLTGLKNYPVKITVICSTLDSGGSSGRLREEFKVISFGDLRRAFLALSNTSSQIKELFNFRFQKDELKGHNFGNIFLVVLFLSKKGNYDKTFNEIKKFLKISHDVLPATLSNSNLYAILENGKIIKGETNIDIPKHNGNLKIKKVFLRPKAKIYSKAIEAIKRANLIVFGPGDLYSSLTQILLIEGISKAIKKSKAKKIFICNLMTKYGETNNFTVLDFTKEIEKYLGKNLDYVIYNNFIPAKRRIESYKKAHPELLDLVKIEKKLPKDYNPPTTLPFSRAPKFIGKNLLLKKGPVEHESKKIAKILISLCR